MKYYSLKKIKVLTTKITVSLLGSIFLVMPAHASIDSCHISHELKINKKTKMVFCKIPISKNFPIGSEKGSDDEKPIIKRNFSKSFYMGQYEVTQEQYKAVMDSSPWINIRGKKRSKKSRRPNLKDFVKIGDNYPAVYVTQEEAILFASILSQLDNEANYRLPTEAEWEYSARALTQSSYYWGDVFDPTYAHSWGNHLSKDDHAQDVTLCPLQSSLISNPEYCANDFGLMHMAGNVWEYTLDSYSESYKEAPTDGHLPVTNTHYFDLDHIVIRGGGWSSESADLRSSNRGHINKNLGQDDVGFRLVRIPH